MNDTEENYVFLLWVGAKGGVFSALALVESPYLIDR